MPPSHKSPALLALTASALAALGTGGRAHAQQAVPASPQLDFRTSYYREGALPASQVQGGKSGERYDITTQQLRVVEPFGSGNAVSGDVTFEAMTGATPWYVQPDASGRPLQVMSGASIEDKRTDATLSLSRSKARTDATVSVGYSTEDDYQSLHGALEVANTMADRATTWSWGGAYSDDQVEPEQGKTATGTLQDKRKGASVFVGYTRVAGEVTVFRTSVSYTQHKGYLSDPYKAAWIDSISNTVPDSRPDTRGQIAWLAGLRRFFKGADAALHLDYRYYHDDWEVDAHSVDVAWHQNFSGGLRVAPGVRWYSQSQAYFYEPYYLTARGDGLASSDYRLSPYGAVSANLTLSWDFAPDWNAGFRYEYYDSGTSYALGKVAVENPGLVDFQVASLGIKKTF